MTVEIKNLEDYPGALLNKHHRYTLPVYLEVGEGEEADYTVFVRGLKVRIVIIDGVAHVDLWPEGEDTFDPETEAKAVVMDPAEVNEGGTKHIVTVVSSCILGIDDSGDELLV